MPELNPAEFTAIDWVLLAAVFVSGLIGLFLGLIREVVTLAVWITAIIATMILGEMAQPYVRARIDPEPLADAICYGLIFVVSLIVFWMLGYAVNAMLHGRDDDVGMGLGPINKLFGFLYGLARGVIVICLFYFGALSISNDIADIFPTVTASRTLPVYHEVTDALYGFVPHSLRDGQIARLGARLDLTFEEAFELEPTGLGATDPLAAPPDPTNPNVRPGKTPTEPSPPNGAPASSVRPAQTDDPASTTAVPPLPDPATDR